MIVKSLSRSSGSTGQLVNYIFRYILEKEQQQKDQEKEYKAVAQQTFFKEDVPFYLDAFKAGQLNFEQEPDPTVTSERNISEQVLNTAVGIAKQTAIGKEFTAREKAAGKETKGITLRLTPEYLIAKSKNGEQFFRISCPTLFSSLPKQAQNSKEPEFIIRHNLRSRSIKGYTREFERLESQRITKRSNSVTIYHHILSLSAQDREHITDVALKDLAAKFIELRGPNNLWVGTKHTDKEATIHVHLAMSAVDLAGRVTRISKAKFQQIKVELDKYQKEQYPELTHSLPDHGKKSRVSTREAIVENVKSVRATDKATLLSVLESIYTQSTSREHFLAQLKEQGYAPYYRSGILTGITTEGNRKFRFSRLGYGQEKLALLNQAKEQEEKSLAELRTLRTQNTQDKTFSRLASLNEKEIEPAIDSKDLEELQSLRDGNNNIRETKDRSTNDKREEKDANDKQQENERDVSDQHDERSR